MNNRIEDLLIFRQVRVSGRPRKTPKIHPVSWLLPSAGWIKINIDGAERGAPGIAGGGGIFCTSRGFVKCCFAIR